MPLPHMVKQSIEEQIIARGITNKPTVEAMKKVPRHEFVPAQLASHAYADHPLSIGYGQTISQPYIVAFMTASLNLQPGDKVLEIGTGSGYQAAILAEILAASNIFPLGTFPLFTSVTVNGDILTTA